MTTGQEMTLLTIAGLIVLYVGLWWLVQWRG
jgi:hypothetical protein